MVDENLSGSRNGRPRPRLHRPGPRSGRGFVDQELNHRPGRGFVDQGLKSSTRSETSSTGSEQWSRIGRPRVESSTRTEIVDRVRGFVDQGLQSSTRSETSSTGSEDSSTRTMKIYRVRGMVDQGLKSSTKSETSSTGSEEWSRICRPGVEIVDRDREFVDHDGGMLDQNDEWAMKIYRLRGMVDQKLKS
ncbi:unnamed protein product [Arabidopsis thaliana]|uniref:Uncharacterized protein n=1 Tax=Arabidopsis thaliana TaxID=3702 RepID=A0A5S9XP86_ARATH|nr:unnamed protein product [Arabidopsis thaliana]